MIPTPDYLKTYATEQRQRGKKLSFKLKCSCGCKEFSILKNGYTDEEKRLIKAYEDKIPNTGGHSIYGGLDPDEKPYSYIKILGIFKKYITFPEAPVFMDINIIKVTCAQCEKEIVVFDNRYHGHEGMTSDDEEARSYVPHFRYRESKVCGVEVTIENELSLEAFTEVMNEQYTFEDYSNSFSEIQIYEVDEKEKKKLLYDFEAS